MADDLNKTGKGDDIRINVNQDHELQYWSEKWNVSKERIKQAVAAVGVMVADVKKYLGK